MSLSINISMKTNIISSFSMIFTMSIIFLDIFSIWRVSGFRLRVGRFGASPSLTQGLV